MHLPETIVVSKTIDKPRVRIHTMSFSATFATKKDLSSGKPTSASPDVADGKPTHVETKRAYDAALELAREAVRVGAVGKGDVEVTISGHVNENNEPKEGWPADNLKIEIRRK